ncbi:MAG: hypothetical protein L0177_04815 [Chloroflexi bacterium]|nr:hypothetical protein [Chloroflexota bacterium]
MVETSTQRLGEVIEASTTGVTTQCYRLYESPPIGSLVRCGDASPVYAIVYEVATRSLDPARHPIPRGEGEATEEGVYLSNPQLNRLLCTEFRALVVGHRGDGQMRRYISPLPPRIHSFVYPCGEGEIREFTASFEFLPALLAAPVNALDDIIAAFLRQASAAHPDPQRFLVDAGKELAALMGGQLQRLNNMLRRLSS